MPGRYVIGTDGVVAYAEGWPPITPVGPTRSGCYWCFQLWKIRCWL